MRILTHPPGRCPLSNTPARASMGPRACAAVVALLGSVSLLPSPGVGQELHLAAVTGVSRIQDTWSGSVGAEVLFAVHPRVRVGGTASVLLRTVVGGRLSTGEPGELEMGYGGAVVEADLHGRWLSARLLIGGGHVTLTDPVVGTRADGDSFVVLEPAARADLPLGESVSLSATAGYRWVDGTGGISDLPAGRLRSPVAAVSLRYRR